MFAIIGAGNVVTAKLIPALTQMGVRNYQIFGLPSDESETLCGQRIYRNENLSSVVANTELIPWLATPPLHARKELLRAAVARPVIVEKPLGANFHDSLYLQENPQLLHRAFTLSYYTQSLLAPLLWALGKSTPPERLTPWIQGTLQTDEPVTLTRAILSEKQARAGSGKNAAWLQQCVQPYGSLFEFAVHMPALAYALGNTDLTVGSADSGHVTIVGKAFTGTVKRPGIDSRFVRCYTHRGILEARAGTRTVRSPWGEMSISAWAAPYLPLVANVLTWIDEGANHFGGDTQGQLAALELLSKGVSAGPGAGP
jgi:hypothetical protein